MHPRPVFFQKRLCRSLLILACPWLAFATQAPLQLDIYDASDNRLMYMTFGYDGAGRNSSRTICMADGTFMRDVMIQYDAQGRRISEVSLNFNGDTILHTNFAENGSDFDITDQFKRNMVGDNIAYSTTDASTFNLAYKQSNEKAASIRYTKDAATGQLQRVDVDGENSQDSYYGLFSYGEMNGVSHPSLKTAPLPESSIRIRSSQIDVTLNLKSAGEVRCELLTLSGRRAALLLSSKIQEGSFTGHFAIDRQLSGGVYCLRVMIDGAVVATGRYLHQSSQAGIVR